MGIIGKGRNAKGEGQLQLHSTSFVEKKGTVTADGMQMISKQEKEKR